MTLCRQKRPTTTHLVATYGQRRRRQRPLLRRQGSSSDRWNTHRNQDDNNSTTKDSTTPGRSKYHLVGAFIYKKPSDGHLTTTTLSSPGGTSDGELALHVFDQYQIKVRNIEPESRVLQKIARECSAGAKGKPTFTSSVYMVQKYVPVRYSSQCMVELNRKAYWSPAVSYRVSLDFRRTYVSSFQHEYAPSGIESATYLSTVCINVS